MLYEQTSLRRDEFRLKSANHICENVKNYGLSPNSTLLNKLCSLRFLA